MKRVHLEYHQIRSYSASSWLIASFSCWNVAPLGSVNTTHLMFISDWHMQFQTLFSLALKLFWKNLFKLKMEQEAEFALKQRWPKNNIKYGSVFTLMMHLDTFQHSWKMLPKLQFSFLGWFGLYIKIVPKCQKWDQGFTKLDVIKQKKCYKANCPHKDHWRNSKNVLQQFA